MFFNDNRLSNLKWARLSFVLVCLNFFVLFDVQAYYIQTLPLSQNVELVEQFEKEENLRLEHIIPPKNFQHVQFSNVVSRRTYYSWLEKQLDIVVKIILRINTRRFKDLSVILYKFSFKLPTTNSDEFALESH